MSSVFKLERPFRNDGGHAFVAQAPAGLMEAIAGRSYYVGLNENGVGVGPGDAIHQAIRDSGAGRYSVWNNSIWFSAPDNSDCNENGREYELTLTDVSSDSGVYRKIADTIYQDDAILLQFVSQNFERNNSVFGNFFRSRSSVELFLKRVGAEMPKRIVEVGCGATPWLGVRFLLDGVERYVATDIMKVASTFPAAPLRDLKLICQQIDVSLTSRWDAVLPENGDEPIAPRGLEVHGEVGFETLDIGDDFDFLMSLAVLEHVMDPDGVYRKMSECLGTGDLMLHFIDLRDHRSFDERPLGFLEMTAEEYKAINTENRLRVSQHRALMDQYGFDIISESDHVLGADGGRHWVGPDEAITPGVTEAMRERFTGEFRSMSLRDLSTLSVAVMCRKR